jgi:hypothetical protein
MKDCEKTLIVVYVNVHGLDSADIPMFLEHVSNSVKSGFDDSVQMLFMPTYDKSGESRVEVLNPRFVPEDEYKQIVSDFNEKYKEILKKIGKDGSNS